MDISINYSKLKDMKSLPTLFFEFHGSESSNKENIQIVEEISKENKDLLTNKIKETYITTISENISDEKLLSEIEEHVESRILIDRIRVVPWLSKNINLQNLEILELLEID